ncbi:hypothetical protein HUJ04_004930 [Dendroctonus ponderosae]|uniref:Uncharacterized protein n=1 Tax=Dendroctonus ponderosae TaxID=77166 RepID=A0AAR5QCP8_DENPD|nr:hypothetical protein HUJ04_004930 [Dendroctonus ponderosae]
MRSEETQISTIKRNKESTEPQIVVKIVPEQIHKLRQQKREDYNEDSSLTITEEPSEKKHIPIYRTKLPERSKPTTQVKDLYDFTDTSPKVKVKNKRRSSIIFDKNTFEILQRLQEKDNKLKKKALRKLKKTYEETVNGIVSNLKQKIAKRNRDKPNECQPHTTTSKQQERDEPRRDECVVHVKNFDKELNIVANLSTVKEREETNPTKEHHKIENPQHEQAVIDTTVEQARAFNTQDLDLIMLQSIGDNSVILKDLESGFGFDDNDPPSPRASTPVKKISILSNKLLRPACKGSVESPVNFRTEIPNANSTMVQAGATASPWRTNWINVKRNPHLVSFKANALPTVDQEMVLNHSIVENYERHCTKRQPQKSTCSVKNRAVQKSILDFVESNIDKENSNLQCSLYDYEDFNSPEKTLKAEQRPVQNVKRKVLGELNNIPAQENLIAPIVETNTEDIENTTYFGFEQSTCSSPKKDQRNGKPLPSRFDLSNLKKYNRRAGRLLQLSPREESALSDDINESVSILENSSGEDVGEIQLFEDPDKMFDQMESFSAVDKKLKRKRLHSFEMDDSDQTCKRKTKKTKLEIEQEAWIQDFNKRCDEIDSSALEIE